MTHEATLDVPAPAGSTGDDELDLAIRAAGIAPEELQTSQAGNACAASAVATGAH